jgi:hypothetical protein
MHYCGNKISNSKTLDVEIKYMSHYANRIYAQIALIGVGWDESRFMSDV